MSSVYSISYDLARNRDHSEFYEILQSLDAWWHYLESTWLVATDKTAEELWALVKPYVGSNDRMLIICVNEQCSGWLPDEAWDWIKENLAIESSATSSFQVVPHRIMDLKQRRAH
jgi:hypothetical protein